MTEWTGHKPATSTVLLDLVTTAHTGRTRFSRSERALFTACEFWAASRNHSLTEFFASEPAAQLQAAENAFSLIGLTETASALKAARLRVAAIQPADSVKEIADDLETQLSRIEEPVDSTLARFAREKV